MRNYSMSPAGRMLQTVRSSVSYVRELTRRLCEISFEGKSYLKEFAEHMFRANSQLRFSSKVFSTANLGAFMCVRRCSSSQLVQWTEHAGPYSSLLMETMSSKARRILLLVGTSLVHNGRVLLYTRQSACRNDFVWRTRHGKPGKLRR